jgi:type II secretory pathway component PulF
VLHSAVMPAIVITWGLVIGYIIVALFLPLVTLLASVEATID